MLKMILAAASACCLAAGMLLLSGGVMVNRVQATACRLQNSRLDLQFDPDTGLCTVTDKKTGKIWSQYYGLPPENGLAYPFDFGSEAWEQGVAEQTGAGTDAGWRLTAAAETDVKLQMKFPAPNLMPAGYQLRIAYRLEEARDFQLIGNFHMEKDGYGFLKTLEFPIASATETITSDGWQICTYDIPLEEFPPYANSFLVHFILRGGSEAAGSVVLGEGGLYGGEPSAAMPTITEVRCDSNAIAFRLNNWEREQRELAPLNAVISFSQGREDEVSFTLSAPEEETFYQTLNYPGTFISGEKDLKWMLPKDAGLYLPAYDLDNAVNRAYSGGEFYVHMGFNMGFYGAVHDTSGDGYFAIVDQPVLSRVNYTACGTGEGKTAYMPQLSQIGTKSLWGADRTVRYRFVESGGYVGIAKAYRQVADEKGYLVTLKEKAEKNPNVLRGSGAHRVDLAIDITDLSAFFEKMRENDITNIMVKFSGLRNNGSYIQLEELQNLGILEQVLEQYGEFYLYEYECYRDLFEKDGEFKIDPAYVELAKPYKVRNVNGMVINGWVDISGLASSILCPAFGRTYLDYKLQKYPMDTYPFPARMYDVLATTSFAEGECYDENHPSDRLTCRDLRLDFVRYSAETYGLDNHTEGAAEYLIPYVNSGEGPLDIMANNGVGVNSMNVSAADRIPLWELVYHDCFELYHHWEHGWFDNNPNMDSDNLFALLYGERGMFLPVYYNAPFMEGSELDQMITRIKRLDQVTQRVKTEEMLSHSFLTADGLVQKTVFASGVEVIVNFSDKTYRFDGQGVAEGGGEPVEKGQAVFPKRQAKGKAIGPGCELVLLTERTKGTVPWPWVGLAASLLAAGTGTAALILRHQKKKKKSGGNS